MLLQIAGGAAGPLVLESAKKHLPERKSIVLRSERLARLLGLDIASDTVTGILQRLDLGWKLSMLDGG